MSLLHVIGVPLDETQPLGEDAQKLIAEAGLVVGESRKVVSRWLKGREIPAAKLWYLDGMKPDEERALFQEMAQIKTAGRDLALFSDTGMPLLFDPGRNVVQRARSLGFGLRCLPGPTSWGTAVALSLWDPPFLIVGFPPREKEERAQFLKRHSSQPAHCVWMDTPYRFEALGQQLREALGPSREVFLAWQIGTGSEVLWWGKLSELGPFAKMKNLEKGEFILISRGTDS